MLSPNALGGDGGRPVAVAPRSFTPAARARAARAADAAAFDLIHDASRRAAEVRRRRALETRRRETVGPVRVTADPSLLAPAVSVGTPVPAVPTAPEVASVPAVAAASLSVPDAPAGGTVLDAPTAPEVAS